MELWHGYRITKILGIRYGYEGLVQRHGRQPLPLRPEVVSTIQTFGGTMLGTSRGPQDATEMVDGLEQLGVDILFIIGGDGTLKGGAALVQEIARRGLRKSAWPNRTSMPALSSVACNSRASRPLNRPSSTGFQSGRSVWDGLICGPINFLERSLATSTQARNARTE